MTRCRLITHADDFGQSQSINEGVLIAHREGILTSASIMPTGAAFEHAVRLIRETPSLDIGIHLTLVEKSPVLAKASIPSLLSKKGRLHHNFISFTTRYFLGKINLLEVRRELEAQIRKVFRYGIPVSHLDSHQHIHMLPQIRNMVIELTRKYKIGAIRFPREKFGAYMLRERFPLPRVFQLLSLNAVCAATSNTNKDILSTDHFVGFFFSGRLNTDNLKKILRHLPRSGTCELICHPGVNKNPSSHKYTHYDRSKELEALLSPEVADIIHEMNIQLVSYRNLQAHHS